MSYKGYLIEKYNDMADAYTCMRLVDEAASLDIDLKLIGVHDTLISKDGIYNNGEKLENRDFVINRYKWGKVKDCLNSLGKRTYNASAAYNRYINKFEQVAILKSEAFKIPDYLLGTTQSDYREISDRLGPSFVAKGLESSQGAQIYLIKNKEEMMELSRENDPEKEWLFEEFIEESAGRDIRLYSIRGKCIACMTRTSNDDFRANVALGASVEKHEITAGISKAAWDIYLQTGLDFLGIDLLHGKERPYLCEINVMPGIEGMEKATGVNVAGAIIETIRSDLISAV